MSTVQSFVCREVPIRLSNTTFAIVNTPTPNSEQVFLNGVLLNFGANNDYTIQQNVITINRVVEADEVVLVNYILNTFVDPPPGPSVSASRLDSRTELVHWCLRKLGAPVIEINVDEDQIEDRIDEALMYFRDYHFDGVERVYLSYKITASTMSLQAPFFGDFERGATIIGQSSGAVGVAYDRSLDGRTIRFTVSNSISFQPGENVSILSTNDTFTIASGETAIVNGDVDNKYLEVGQKVLSITNIIPQESSTIGGNLGGMFDFQYQFALNNMFNLASTDLVTYQVYQQYISQWEYMFRGTKGIRFNRKTNRVYLDVQHYAVDRYIVLEAWVAADPTQYTEIYTDEFVREYACALIKLQWGNNLKKFSGITLTGGTTLNGQQIYEEATAELEKLRERVRKEFELPPDFFVG